MKRIITVVLILCLLYLFWGCNSKNKNNSTVPENKQIVEEWIGKKIILPDSLTVLFKDTLFPFYSSKFYKTNTIKILTPIDGGCHVCLHQLDKWNNLIKKAKKNEELDILFYITGTTVKHFKNEFYHKINIDYPLIIDTNLKLHKINNFPFQKKYQTFLLDRKKQVKVIGNPVFNSKIKDLYLNELKKMNKKKYE
jgi:hypothetical protein